jgi:hypothetical protein
VSTTQNSNASLIVDRNVEAGRAAKVQRFKLRELADRELAAT